MSKTKTLAYCRVSTENQREEKTIEIQEKAIKDYADSNNLEIIKVFKDDGVSGGLENRPALSGMFDYLKQNKEVKTVIIFKLDRLARDNRIQENLLYNLRKLGVKLISTKEPDLDSKDITRIAFRQFLGIMSELEKGYITMRLSAGRLNKASKGKYAGGGVALGYKAKNKELRVDSKNADIVRQIFSLNKKKKSLRQIAQVLNDQSIPTARNGKWQPSTISYILNNKIYQGSLNYKEVSTVRKDLVLV